MTRFTRRSMLQSAAIVPAAALVTNTNAGATPVATPEVPTSALVETTSTFFATVDIESAVTLYTKSDGDLWPTTWADDDALYTLNGDGKGFDLEAEWHDLVMNRMEGTPETGITGEVLSVSDEISDILGDEFAYNRKPTGVVAVDGNGDGKDELYAAIQDLKQGTAAFDDAPNASISMSLDYGKTWTKSTEAMFSDHTFTTIMFLDYGQSNQHASVLGPEGADYVYAYGIDYNWRDSFANSVDDPTDLYLARVPIGEIMSRDAWEFYSGLDGEQPVWSTDIEERTPVLSDERRVYTHMNGPGINDMTVISQGSVVYNPALDRYIYTSWTEYTFEFYEAPQPWGPWNLFAHKDFGGYPWFGGGDAPGCPGPKNGGYATVVPSRFISEDGKTMWVQSNWWVNVDCGDPTYRFCLRKMTVEPFTGGEAAVNEPDATTNLALDHGAVVIEKCARFGQPQVLNDGATNASEDSYDVENKALDFWGYTWPTSLRINRLEYTTGEMFPDGGWFAAGLNVQVRREFIWHDVAGLRITPEYPLSEAAEPFTTFSFTFDTEQCDGVRIIGVPGGRNRFTSISELEVYLDG